MEFPAPILRIPIFSLLLIILTCIRLRIKGDSMSPTYIQGDYILVNRRKYDFNKPKRGDIVLFHHPGLGNKYVIKRIVGVPGELIRLKKPESYVLANSLSNLANSDPTLYSEQILDEDEYFLLGDNPSNSLDSRRIGPVKLNLILGKVWFKYWPINFGV